MPLIQDLPTVPRQDPHRRPEEPGYEMAPWDLSDLLPEASDEVTSAEIEHLVQAVEKLEASRSRLHAAISPREFLGILRRYEKVLAQADVLGGYASLWFASDTQDPGALSYRNRIRQVLTQVENRYLFFTLWWKGLSEAEAERLLPSTELGLSPRERQDYRHYLRELRRFSPHTLDERSEQIINVKNANGIESVLNIYSMITSRLEFRLEVDGETLCLNDTEIRRYFYHPDPAVREATFQELFRVYSAEEPILAQIYTHRVRDWHNEYVELRGVRSPVAMRNLSNDVSDETVEALLEAVHRNASLFQDYFRLKADWLGLDRLRRYDVYAPLADSHRTVEYADAARTVLDTFYGFHPRMGQLAERIFTERHIDAAVRKGKQPGAFCATIVPDVVPFVHVNFHGKVRDVTVLAHELGHAVHSMLASDHSLLTQHPSLPLGETASVFAEMLMTDRLLATEDDPLVRREILASAVDDIYATVMRQAYFVRFELDAHAAVLDPQNNAELSDLYFENLRQQFGDSLDVAEGFRYEWVAIPHLFMTPFYCYAYSFGQLLVLALYRRYQEEGEAFKEPYLRMLAQGGSARPVELLGELGIDATRPEFWQGGFEVVNSLIDELKRCSVTAPEDGTSRTP